mgnify:FL=1
MDVDLTTGTSGPYTDWVVETHLDGTPVRVRRTPYPEDARRILGELREAHPDLVFSTVRQHLVRTEEDW